MGPHRFESHDAANVALPCYISFILRCQVSARGGVRARLLDVRTGKSYVVRSLNELPNIVCRLLNEVPAGEGEA